VAHVDRWRPEPTLLRLAGPETMGRWELRSSYRAAYLRGPARIVRSLYDNRKEEVATSLSSAATRKT
jgi:hypothetical protein